MGNPSRNRKPEKSSWRIAVAIIVGVLLACGLLITLDIRKIAVEKKVDRKAAQQKTLSNTAPELPVQPPDPQN